MLNDMIAREQIRDRIREAEAYRATRVTRAAMAGRTHGRVRRVTRAALAAVLWPTRH